MLSVGQLIERFRSEVADPWVPGGNVQNPDEDSLWKDGEIRDYIAEAQSELARRTLMFNARKTLSYSAGDELLEHPKDYLDFRRAYAIDGDNYRPLLFRNVDEMEQALTDDYGIGTRTDWVGESGWPPRFLVGDYEQGAFKMVPQPDKAGEVQLLYYRAPELSGIGSTAKVAFDKVHHVRALMHWMKALAYRKQDAETLDLQRAREFEAQFDGMAQQIYGESLRGRRRPGTVQYGGL